MSSLPQSISLGISGGGLSRGDDGGGGRGGASSSSGAGAPGNRDQRMQLAEWLVLDLLNPHLRENALLELSKSTSATEASMRKRNSIETAEHLALDLNNPDLRENAIVELSYSETRHHHRAIPREKLSSAEASIAESKSQNAKWIEQLVLDPSNPDRREKHYSITCGGGGRNLFAGKVKMTHTIA
ncbi:hypothetical protein FXO38_31001 [Capsicum annuum]|nr:hypothetical protein FXO38_31001 [Capsicum annuum]